MSVSITYPDEAQVTISYGGSGGQAEYGVAQYGVDPYGKAKDFSLSISYINKQVTISYP